MTHFLRDTATAGLTPKIPRSGARSSAPDAQDKKRYAMRVRSFGQKNFERACVDAREAVDKLGVELIYKGPTEYTADSQMTLINPPTAERVKAIKLAANGATALTPPLNRVMQRGNDIVTWNSTRRQSGPRRMPAPSGSRDVRYY